jgi:hypothetical protein
MKNALQILALALIAHVTFGQKSSNLIIFAEDATPFYAIVNGIKQNTQPETNVKITGLTNQANQIKVVFKDQTIPTLDKQIYFQEMNVEATMKISNTKKGYKLRYFGEVSMGAAVVDPAQNIITYHTTEPVATNVQPNTTTTTVITTNTQTNTESQPARGDNINMNVNVGGVGFNVNVNEDFVNENSGGANTTTTTTTTTTSSVGNAQNDLMIDPGTQVVYVENYSGGYGCTVPSQSMNSIKAAINDEAFSDDKMMVAKQATKNKCLTTSQVKEIANLFDFEDDRLEYAKFAYDYTYDIDNYYQINSIFNFSSSKSELNKYISQR